MALIQLASRARPILRQIARSGSKAREVRRAQVLLWLDAHKSVRQVAIRLRLSPQAVYDIVQRYQARRSLQVRERIRDQTHPGRPATVRERTVCVIQQLLPVAPARYRYRSPVWTVPMLRRQVQRRLKRKISTRTVRRALHQIRYRFKRPRYVLALRPATWRQAKGGPKRA